jgi:TonB-linked outer membrane protein, SusC/RagA family
MKHLNYLCNYKHIIFNNLLLISLIACSLVVNTAEVQARESVNVTLGDNITISIKNKTIKEAFLEIEKKSKFVFIYNSETVNLNQKVSVEAKDEPIRTVLDRLLKGTTVDYEISDHQIVVFNKNNKNSQKQSGAFTVNGKITDETGEPLIGVSILVKGTSQGTITDIDGKYSLSVPGQNTRLVFSYIGFTKMELQAQKMLNVKMISEAENLNEVVVVGYGTVKKNDLTGSVSTLKSKDFNVGLVTAPSQLIQGRVAGVNITNNGGEPGGGATVRVRGSNSIRSGQDPLYVVDGVPLNVSDDQQPSGASISGVGDTSKKNPLNFLNPDDIESIDVLKDASATAIYGARGANGVIIVTTKKGKEGAAKVSYSGYVSVSSLPEQYPVLSAAQFRSFAAEKGLTSIEDGGASTNWQDEIFRTAVSSNHNLSVSGGGKNGNYRASLGYQDQEGIIKRTGMEKYTGRFSASQKTFNDRLLIEASLMASRNIDQRAPIGETGGYEGDLLLSALKLNPTFPVYNSDGTYYQKSKDVRNPVAMLNLTNDKTQTDRILANVTGTLTILKDLKYKMNVALDQTKATRKVTQDKSLIYLTDNGTADINNVEAGNFLIENYLTYNFNLAKKHSFNLLGGHSYQKFRNYYYGMSETGFTVDNIDYLYDLSYGKNKQVTSTSGITVNELQSFFGRVNYGLLDKYLLTVNFRADGSTKFGENNKYGYFPSAALAWRMSEENFIKKLNVFENLKLRLSWGITGNQEIPNKISQMLLGSTSGAILNGGSTVVPGITLTRTPNPNLKWEKTEQVDLGVDFSVLKGRLSGTIDVFSKTTKDVLLEVYSVSPAPTTKVWSNVPNMKIENKGLEIGLNGVLLANKDFNWTLGGNFSTIKNKVKDLPMSYITTGSPSGPGITGFSSQIIKSGYPIGTFWGYNFLGFDENGKSLYELDENGNKVEKCIGNAQPDFTFNFNTSFSWKRFDLSLFFNGVVGNDIYNNLANVIDQLSLFSKGFNTTVHATTLPESLDNVLDYSSRYIEDGSYLRLASVNLGYTFNMKNSKWISNLRVYATANNLFVLTGYSGYDPEVNAAHASNGVPSLGIGWTTYPMARSFTLGVTMDF